MPYLIRQLTDRSGRPAADRLLSPLWLAHKMRKSAGKVN